MEFRTLLDSPFLKSKCLTFLALDGALDERDLELVKIASGNEPSPWPPALTYSLETGLVRVRDPRNGERFTIPLREGHRLSNWEPMTPEKFDLMAAELDVIGADDLGLIGRVSEADMDPVVVSPQGHVFRLHNGSLLISDIARLAQSQPAPLMDTGALWDQWNHYSSSSNIEAGPRVALVGSGTLPRPEDPSQLTVDSLTDAGRAAASPLEESDNDPEADWARAAAAFVQRQFGVDVNAIDWKAANRARIINGSFAHTKPFDPDVACGALQLAATKARQTQQSRRVQAVSREPTTTQRKPQRPGQ